MIIDPELTRCRMHIFMCFYKNKNYINWLSQHYNHRVITNRLHVLSNKFQ